MRVVTLTIFVTACAATTTPTSKGGPRGLRASEQRELAHQEDELAKERTTGSQMSVMTPGGHGVDQPIGMPWFRSWNSPAVHSELAASHRSRAAALEAAYQDACGSRSIEDVSLSPLVRYGVGGWPTQSGAIVYLSAAAGAPDELLAALKCHRAFMMLAPLDMDDCPLDLPGLALDARGDANGVTVSISVKDAALVPELQRRAAHDLEVGHRMTSDHHE